MKYDVIRTSKFKKDFKKAIKSGCSVKKFKEIIDLLQDGIPLPPKNKDHSLTGNWNGYRECHIEPDWLLIYRIDKNELVLVLARTGSHSNLDLD
ncbi:MAG: type II toxin-antitoxin system YafQ family toxin [Ruminococcus sp.]|nr:type II toxin-antitoxin system YafQ family toxin [Ruminococcus sp.]